jgi:Leucine-rich repeat (LRR) protein
MQRLTLLELFENQLVDVPTNALGPLTALTFLDLRGNALTQLPILPANGVLDTLILSDNELTHLEGGGIAKCVQLTVLNLRQNRLSRLNAVDLAALPLKTLDLSNNELSDLPGELGRIASLTRIALEGNPLRRIRRGLLDQGTEALKRFLRSRLSEGLSLCFFTNILFYFDHFIHFAPNSEQAELDPSDPTATFTGSAPNSSFLLPNEVAIRESIQQASYAHQQSKGLLPLKKRELNRLPNQALPPNVFQTPWIAMELDENQLDVVSPDRFDMFASSLQRFSASTNKLTALPHSLFQCAQLQTLSLARNQLSADSLPVRELGGLHHLASVDLSFNPYVFAAVFKICNLAYRVFCGRLGCIPEALFWLPSLAELLLQQTNLSGALPDLGRMLGRSTLVSLQLASNHIDGFQEPDLRALPNLTYLNIENNDFVKYAINHFCFFLFNCHCLIHSCWFSNHRLPPELGVSSHLKAFLVNGNPIRVPPFSIISKGTPAVRSISCFVCNCIAFKNTGFRC